MLNCIKKIIQMPLLLVLVVTRAIDLFSRRCLLELGCYQQPAPANYKTPEDSPGEAKGGLSVDVGRLLFWRFRLILRA